MSALRAARRAAALGIALAAGAAPAQDPSVGRAVRDTPGGDPAAAIQAVRQFQDWLVGCDNLRGCIALGLMAEDGVGGYVAIRRGGEAGDAPAVALNVAAPDAPDAPADYRFWVVGGAGAAPAAFVAPGRDTADPAVLTNPGLTPDGLGLSALALGRGPGDCGARTDWAWTGTGFALLLYREMQACRGVLPDDWPVLFAAAL